jgi:hypothetical protein
MVLKQYSVIYQHPIRKGYRLVRETVHLFSYDSVFSERIMILGTVLVLLFLVHDIIND